MSKRTIGELPTEAFKIRHGGWYDGDNHKPGRGWYFVCGRCRHVGLGWLLRQSAVQDATKHVCASGSEPAKDEA